MHRRAGGTSGGDGFDDIDGPLLGLELPGEEQAQCLLGDAEAASDFRPPGRQASGRGREPGVVDAVGGIDDCRFLDTEVRIEATIAGTDRQDARGASNQLSLAPANQSATTRPWDRLAPQDHRDAAPPAGAHRLAQRHLLPAEHQRGVRPEPLQQRAGATDRPSQPVRSRPAEVAGIQHDRAIALAKRNVPLEGATEADGLLGVGRNIRERDQQLEPAGLLDRAEPRRLVLDGMRGEDQQPRTLAGRHQSSPRSASTGAKAVS